MLKELPSVYADRVGQWYMALISTEHKKNLGQFLTPVEVAKFMARFSNPANRPSLRILDPGAGAGVLSCALCEVLEEQRPGLQEIILEAYEIDRQLAIYLEGSLAYAKEQLQTYGISLKYSVNTIDFVMTHALTLNDSLSLTHSYHYNLDRFDIVICNPPYFKIPKSDSRAKAAASIVHGQPNIYALFMAISAELLKDDGVFICITPRSYTTGSYFRLFRARFFSAERQTSLEQASFNGSQVSSRVFAKTPRLSTSCFSLL
jgi:adenine-specific DNA-methyltransferase